jgi:hypothetical protein
MMEEAMSEMDSEDIEEAADLEVEAALHEVTLGVMGQAAAAPKDVVKPAAAAAVVDDEEEKEMEAMRARLAKLNA